MWVLCLPGCPCSGLFWGQGASCISCSELRASKGGTRYVTTIALFCAASWALQAALRSRQLGTHFHSDCREALSLGLAASTAGPQSPADIQGHVPAWEHQWLIHAQLKPSPCAWVLTQEQQRGELGQAAYASMDGGHSFVSALLTPQLKHGPPVMSLQEDGRLVAMCGAALAAPPCDRERECARFAACVLGNSSVDTELPACAGKTRATPGHTPSQMCAKALALVSFTLPSSAMKHTVRALRCDLGRPGPTRVLQRCSSCSPRCCGTSSSSKPSSSTSRTTSRSAARSQLALPDPCRVEDRERECTLPGSRPA